MLDRLKRLFRKNPERPVDFQKEEIDGESFYDILRYAEFFNVGKQDEVWGLEIVDGIKIDHYGMFVLICQDGRKVNVSNIAGPWHRIIREKMREIKDQLFAVEDEEEDDDLIEQQIIEQARVKYGQL